MIEGLEDLLALPPYGLPHADKRRRFDVALAALTRHHAGHCADYAKILAALGFDPAAAHASVADYPFLPARLFKTHDLRSVPAEAVRKVMTSSGTGGQPSRIALDAVTATLQTKVLSRIVTSFLGRERLPMLVIDAPSTAKGRAQFSARTAGIVGFSIFGRNVTFALNDDLELDLAAIEGFCAAYGQRPVLLFGFTFVVFEHLIEALRRQGRRLGLDHGILIHGGGWKKLADRAVDNDTFRRLMAEATGVRRVHNYYGLVEQTGSIFMECEHGRLHCSNYSDIVVRGPDFAELPFGQRGMVELLSLLPHSYPGHILLTEDEGTIDGEDDCPCGRFGKYFRIHGRVANAEIRGCSDAYAAR